ncbi:MAG: hypothetical protein ABI076_03735, partial [Acidobacteriaceae bacterium]
MPHSPTLKLGTAGTLLSDSVDKLDNRQSAYRAEPGEFCTGAGWIETSRPPAIVFSAADNSAAFKIGTMGESSSELREQILQLSERYFEA